MSACSVVHGDCLDLAADLATRDEQVDLLCVDAPYSAKTHAGHDAAAAFNAAAAPRAIAYRAWTESDVRAFVGAWAPVTRGWMVSLTDDVLFPVWREAMRETGRTCFQDVPAVITGMTVRLAGDGPSSWAIHLAVSRPKSLKTWGTLPGAYVLPSARQPVVGGKPYNLMRAIVRDYSRPGDLVCDPCCGAGTTLVAALAEGRRALGGDIDETHVAMARRWCADLPPIETDQGTLWSAGAKP